MEAFPDLPLDIARRILEDVANTHRSQALKSVLVSKAVRTWIDPILYRSVTLLDMNSGRSFSNAISIRNDPTFFAKNVKYLFILELSGAQPVAFESALHILSVCTGIISLGLWSYDYQGYMNYNPSLLSGADLKRLSVYHIKSSEFSQIPENITHFSCHMGSAMMQLLPEGFFLRCPCLTHLHIADFDFLLTSTHQPETILLGAIEPVLACLPSSVQIFILEVRFPRVFDSAIFFLQEYTRVIERVLAQITDPRFVLLCTDPQYFEEVKGMACFDAGSPVVERFARELEDPYTSSDTWTFAEQFVSKRARRDV
ncbi:hypothetical protein BDZ89DRAFT_329928 [Hymenopellis radicata]|nr:hypothetical protein BDZ89DRAFT_329928 [Hymenopellis radicata]